MIGSKIKELRIKRSVTQKELAKQTGISLGAIQGYEQNRYKPKFEQLQKIAVALHCDVRHLMPNEFDVIENIPVLKDGTLFLATSDSDSKLGNGDMYNCFFDDAHKKEFLKAISAAYGGEEIKKVTLLPSDELPTVTPGAIYNFTFVNFSERINDNLKELNQQGQEKLYNYSCDLLEIPKYRADSALNQDETTQDETVSPKQEEPDKNQ